VKVDLRTSFSGSGVISLSPRVQLRNRDSLPAYPTIKIPGDQHRLGNDPSYFDDFNSLRVFTSSLREYPSMIPLESPTGFRETLTATPNTTASLTIYTDSGNSSYSEAPRNPYTSSSDGFDNYRPFNEYDAVVSDDQNYVIIPINIANSASIRRSFAAQPHYYGSEASTGVYYFSPSTSGFRSIGTRDPVNSEDVWKIAAPPFITIGNRSYAGGVAQRGLSIFQHQYPHAGFVAAFADTYTGSEDLDAVARAYFTASFQSLGQPSNRYGGPNNYRLFATSSEIIKMSDYINAPFLIEEIEISLSGTVNKIFDRQFTNGYSSDVYTFFLLRQTGPALSASPTSLQVSSSQREIITFKSILLYKEQCVWSGTSGPAGGTWPVTGPVEFNVDGSYFKNKDTELTLKWDGPASERRFFGTASLNWDIDLRLAPKVVGAQIYETYQGQTQHSAWGGGSTNAGQEFIETTGSRSPAIRVFSAIGTPRTVVDDTQIATKDSNQQLLNFKADGVSSPRFNTPFVAIDPPTKIASYGYNIDVYDNKLSVGSQNAEKVTYLVKPEDSLIFGINALPSAPMASLRFSQFVDPSAQYGGGVSRPAYDYYDHATGSWMHIPVQNTRMIIRGRYLKDGEKYHTPLPQLTNTVAVHESLHSENPVLDQFELNASHEYVGTLRDQLITGSMTVPNTGWPRSGSSELIEGNNALRRVIGTVTGGTAGDMSSIQRTIRVIDAVEKYYDSFVPDPIEMWRAAGYSPIYLGQGTGTVLQIKVGGFDVPIVTSDGEEDKDAYILKISPAPANGTTYPKFEIENYYSPTLSAYFTLQVTSSGADLFFGGNYVNDTWLSSYPFSPIFSSLQRRQRSKELVLAYELNFEIVNIGANSTSSMGYERVDYINTNVVRGVRKTSLAKDPSFFSRVGIFSYESIEPNAANTFLYGFGDSYLGMHRPVQIFETNGLVQSVVVEKPRGFKYGLINANPTATTAVYRSTRYGQLRDMLEQRQYAALLIENPESNSNLFTTTKTKSGKIKRERVQKKEPPTKFPVLIKFRDPVHENPTLYGSARNPIDTQSSNISIYATSSLPFFDDDTPRNRDYPSGSL
jgi:hypothetical protein